MPMTSREVVRRTILFENPDRIPGELKWDECFDFHDTRLRPFPDSRPQNSVDEWGCVWANIGVSKMGEVKEHPLKDWHDWNRLKIPDIRDPARLAPLQNIRQEAEKRFLLGYGTSMYERVHFIRGLEDTWVDIHMNPDKLCKLLDVLVDMNLYMVEKYAAAGLDVIQMDQQENMELERLGREFGGRIAFWCPVDIQNTMARGNPDEIRRYCHDLVRHLGRPEGGFIAKLYGDPIGAGHTPEAVDAMCDEFMKLSREFTERQTPHGARPSRLLVGK